MMMWAVVSAHSFSWSWSMPLAPPLATKLAQGRRKGHKRACPEQAMGTWVYSSAFPIASSTSKLVPLATALLFFLVCSSLPPATEAYDAFDPNGNITIKWDVMQWTPDGYVAVVTIYNYQKYRHIEAPGWQLRWTWQKKEVIWSMFGALATEQGDCSRFKGNVPYSCMKNQTVVDLLPGTPYNMQIANCCKGGVISSWVQDPANAASSFQITVGQSGNTNNTVKMPQNFILKAPDPGYTCGYVRIVKPTKFWTQDGRRVTQALITWEVICTYSEFVAHKTPTCCVSLSSFYNSTIVNCPTCSCGCKNTKTQCVKGDSPYSASAIDGPAKFNYKPLVKCTEHMCPIRVNWHVKLNYKDYWRVKVTITNLNYWMNYTHWNLVVQNPEFDYRTRILGLNYKLLSTSEGTIDGEMLWGVKNHNDILMQAGPHGSVQSELLFRKASATFTLNKGWAFPQTILFNGDYCVMPPPDAYPWVPSAI